MGSYQLILPSLVGEVRPLFTSMSIGIAIIASENNKMYSKEKLNTEQDIFVKLVYSSKWLTAWKVGPTTNMLKCC